MNKLLGELELTTLPCGLGSDLFDMTSISPGVVVAVVIITK